MVNNPHTHTRTSLTLSRAFCYNKKKKKKIDVVGTPTADDLEGIGSDKARNYMRSMPFKPKISWAKMFPNASGPCLAPCLLWCFC